MRKRLLSLLILSIFIGINTQPPTDAATTMNNILKKMGVTGTTFPTGCYVEVSPDGNINTYDANHECTKTQPISAHIKKMLNKKDSSGSKQEEAAFYCYRLGTKLKIQSEPNQPSKRSELMGTVIQLCPTLISANLMDFCFKNFIYSDATGKEPTKEKFLMFNKYMIPRLIVFYCISRIASALTSKLSKFSERQDEKKLDRKTFYNLGFHTDGDCSHLLEKKKSPLFKKAFEEGRKAKKVSS